MDERGADEKEANGAAPFCFCKDRGWPGVSSAGNFFASVFGAKFPGGLCGENGGERFWLSGSDCGFGDGKRGKIINIASVPSFFGRYTVPAYAASNGGVAQLTKALCNEWAGKGINVNALAPGYMDTEMNKALTPPENIRFKEITDRTPAGAWGTAEDMKDPCVFLASEASTILTVPLSRWTADIW